jgi:hypothetical protein
LANKVKAIVLQTMTHAVSEEKHPFYGNLKTPVASFN